MYDKTGSIRATARNLGLNRKTITKYVNEYLEAKSSSESEFVAYLKANRHTRMAVNGRRRC